MELEKLKLIYHQFKKLENVKILRYHSFWDGPINGICLFNDQQYWFELVDEWLDHHDGYPEDEDDLFWSRRYVIWKLNEEQVAKEYEIHYKFVTMVGGRTGNELGNDSSLDLFTITPETQSQYYKQYKNKAIALPKVMRENLIEDLIIGWFER